MKILHVNKFVYRRGGAEGYMLDVADLQRREGHEVEFFGMQHPDNIEATYTEHFPSQVEFGQHDASIVERIQLSGRMMYSSSARRGIGEVLDDFAPDIVHLNNIYHQLSPSILRPIAKRGIPAVLTLHDYKLACPTYQFLADGEICEACIGGHFSHAIRKRCNRGSLAASIASATELAVHTRFGAYDSIDLFLCPSVFLSTQMERANVYPDRLRHNPNFVDLGKIEPAQRPGDGIVFAGRLSHEKGVDVLIDAAAALGEELHIAGSGPDAAVLEERAASAGAKVTFHGRLATDELHELMRRSRVSVLPARWYENQPLSVLESYGCAVPVIASDLGGLPEIVVPGVTGDLVPPNDFDSLAAALKPYVEDADLAYQHGIEGRKMVEREYSPRVHLARLHGFYDEAIERRDRRGSSG